MRIVRRLFVVRLRTLCSCPLAADEQNHLTSRGAVSSPAFRADLLFVRGWTCTSEPNVKGVESQKDRPRVHDRPTVSRVTAQSRKRGGGFISAVRQGSKAASSLTTPWTGEPTPSFCRVVEPGGRE